MKAFLAVLFLSIASFAQTSTSYTIPTGSTCSNIEACIYHPDGIPNDGFGRFQTAFGIQGGLTQLDLSATVGYFCNSDGNLSHSTAVWDVASTPLLGPTAELFTLDCNPVTNDSSQPDGSIHAEIFAYSQVVTYRCGVRVVTTCHKTVWTVTDGSFVEKINP
jgi:hypothetical protein